MALPIYTQGTLDGLCGVYAFVNGYIHLCVPYRFLIDGSIGGNFSTDLYKFALNAIPKKSFPEVIWAGMDCPMLRRTCEKACSKIEREIGGTRHVVMTPFGRGQFRSVERFFDELDQFRNEIPSTFAILGFEGQTDHWCTLKSDEGDRIRLLNNGGESFVQKSDISFSKKAPRSLRQEETIIVRMIYE